VGAVVVLAAVAFGVMKSLKRGGSDSLEPSKAKEPDGTERGEAA
jgi:hypothetical protein